MAQGTQQAEPTRAERSKASQDQPSGGAVVAGGVVGLNLILLTMMPFLIVVGAWTGISIYALVKIIGSAPDEPNAEVILLIFVGVVASIVVLLAGLVSLIGKLGDPKPKPKRRS
jgi:hypothetical protein